MSFTETERHGASSKSEREEQEELLRQLLQEMRTMNSRLTDVLMEPERRDRNGTLESEYGDPEMARQLYEHATDELLTSYQSASVLWAEAFARGLWMLAQFSPANLYRQIGDRIAILDESVPAV